MKYRRATVLSRCAGPALALQLALCLPAHAIGNGTNTGTPRAVVQVRALTSDGDAALCSGTVVAPNWVLTANHCTTGKSIPCMPELDAGLEDLDLDPDCLSDSPPAGCFSVRIPGEGSSDPEGATSRAYRVVEVRNLHSDAKMNMCDGDAVEEDLALLRLETIVEPEVQPVHVPLLDGLSCPEGDFVARIMGYGPNEFGVEGPDPARRRYYEDGGWHRNAAAPDPGVYYKAWSLTPLLPGMEVPGSPTGLLAANIATEALLNYDGMHGGDSGGPIFYSEGSWSQPDELALCGAASRSWVEINGAWDASCALAGQPWGYCPMIQVANHYAPTDSLAAQDFLEEHLVSGGAFVCETGADSDGDGAVDACDICPGKDDLADSDGDGVRDCDDICPGFDDAIDPDGDGRPSGCDLCPMDDDMVVDGNAESNGGDYDADGVCNSADNCPTVVNADQQNQNLDWELATGASLRGDRCDAVPTARAWLDDPELIDDTLGGIGVYTWRQSQLVVQPQPSWSKDGTKKKHVFDVATALRFCQEGLGFDCMSPDSIDEAELNLGLDPSLESPDMAWHQITLEGQAPGSEPVWAYAQGVTEQLSWDYVSDFLRWKSEGTMDLPAPDSPSAGMASGLSGYIWLHAQTPVGGSMDAGTGIHGKQLSNSAVWVDPEYTSSPEIEVPDLGLMPEFDLYWLGDPPPWLGWRPERLSVAGGREQVVLTERGVGLLRPDGLAVEISEQVGAGALEALSLGHLWSSATSPPPPQLPMALAFNPEGTALVEAIYLSGGRLQSRRDLAREEGLATALFDLEGPGADRGFLSLYAPTFRSVYRVGGASGQVWRGDLEEGVWVRLGEGRSAAVAVGAEAGGQRLLVLEQGRAGLELISVDAFTGEVERLAAGQGLPRGQSFGLFTDPRGETYLHASDERGWSLYSLGRMGTPALLAEGEGQLRGAPLADGLGVSLSLSLGRESGEQRYSYAELERPILELADLSELLSLAAD